MGGSTKASHLSCTHKNDQFYFAYNEKFANPTASLYGSGCVKGFINISNIITCMLYVDVYRGLIYKGIATTQAYPTYSGISRSYSGQSFIWVWNRPFTFKEKKR